LRPFCGHVTVEEEKFKVVVVEKRLKEFGKDIGLDKKV